MTSLTRMAPSVYRLEVPFTGCWTGVSLVLAEENILIDSGACAETVDTSIVPALRELGYSLGDIAWVALTHIHGDHVGGCARIQSLAPHIRFACYRASADRLREPLLYSKQIRARFPGHSAGAPAVLEGVTADSLLHDGDTLGPLRLIHTPGHDSDSCCYLDTRSGTLITGDSLQLNGTATQGCALLMDGRYDDSLNKLLRLPIQSIVCGHEYLPLGGHALGPEAAAHFLQACKDISAHNRGFVHGMQAAGVSDAVEIAKALIDEVGGVQPEHLFLPLYTVTGYMEKRRMDCV